MTLLALLKSEHGWSFFSKKPPTALSWLSIAFKECGCLNPERPDPSVWAPPIPWKLLKRKSWTTCRQNRLDVSFPRSSGISPRIGKPFYGSERPPGGSFFQVFRESLWSYSWPQSPHQTRAFLKICFKKWIAPSTMDIGSSQGMMGSGAFFWG